MVHSSAGMTREQQHPMYFLGGKPLSPENQALCDKLCRWFLDRQLTRNKLPQFTSGEGAGHIADEGDHLITINESLDSSVHPLEAVMLEEIAHWAASSADERSSADYSPQFLAFIAGIIGTEVEKKPKPRVRDGRDYQSILFQKLWKIVEADIRSEPMTSE